MAEMERAKARFLKVISGILKPTEGSVSVRGNIVPMLELGSGFDFDLTGRENIYLNGSILGYSRHFLDEKYDEIVSFSELGEFIEMPIRNYFFRYDDALGFFHCHSRKSGNFDRGRNSGGGGRGVPEKKPPADVGIDGRRHHGAVRISQPGPDSGDVRPGAVAGSRTDQDAR